MRRITVFLPVATDAEMLAASSVRDWLKTELSGFTMSLLDPPAFEGWWRGDHGWILDLISLLTIDIPLSFQTDKFVSLLSAEIAIRYVTAGSTQQELGISVSDLVATTYG
jgi:hypothetical protein